MKTNVVKWGGGTYWPVFFKWRYRSLVQILKTYGKPFEAHWEQLRRLQNFSLFTFRPPTSFLQIKKGKMLNLTGLHIGSVHYTRLSEDFLIHLPPHNPPECLLCGLKCSQWLSPNAMLQIALNPRFTPITSWQAYPKKSQQSIICIVLIKMNYDLKSE